MEPLRRMRLMTVRLSLLLTFVAAAVAYPLNTVVMHGILLGGIGGIVEFWLSARRLARLAQHGDGERKVALVGWSVVRMGLYGLVLVKAYTLDQSSLYGFLSAAAALFIVRAVVVFLGVTGLDLRQGED